jgi:hypothetical protein
MLEQEIEMTVTSTKFALLGARIAVLFSLTLLTFLYSSAASAVPSFMRQTGLECGVCHSIHSSRRLVGSSSSVVIPRAQPSLTMLRSLTRFR